MTRREALHTSRVATHVVGRDVLLRRFRTPVIGEIRRDPSMLLATFLSCELLEEYDNLGSARSGDRTGKDANGPRS